MSIVFSKVHFNGTVVVLLQKPTLTVSYCLHLMLPKQLALSLILSTIYSPFSGLLHLISLWYLVYFTDFSLGFC